MCKARSFLCAVFVMMVVTTLTQADERVPSLDFEECKPKTERLSGGLGSTTVQMVGESRHGCVMLYGTEIENPFWDGFLDSICVVPRELGLVKFETQVASGPDLSGLDEYCVEMPTALEQRAAEEYVHPGEGLDFDEDGYADADDNCPAEENPRQVDSDRDAVGDICDLCRTVPAPGYSNGCPEDTPLPQPLPGFRSRVSGTMNGVAFDMIVWRDHGRERREIDFGEHQETVLLRSDEGAIYLLPQDSAEGVVLAYRQSAADNRGALPQGVRRRFSRLGSLARPVKEAAWLAHVFRDRPEDEALRFRVHSTRYQPVDSKLFEMSPELELRDLR